MSLPARVYELRNPVQAYPWGSRTAIAELLGEPSPAAEPQAEMWMGDHPRGPSEIHLGGEWLLSSEAIRRHGSCLLGEGVLRAYGGRLPFLYKVLAAAEPLSVQAHPDPEQARRGFAREEAAGIPRGAFTRNYRDRNHKPEILYPLGPFVLLRGFRPAAEVDTLLARAGVGRFLPPAAGPGGLRALFAAFLELEGEALSGALQRLERGRARLEPTERTWVGRLARAFPGDRGALAPLLLRLLRLGPGEAIYTGPGVLHAYLGGLGIELMANSDNVLRGACTGQHVDPDELLRVVRFEEADEGRIPPATTGGNGRAEEVHFETPADELLLSRLSPALGRPAVFEPSRTGAGAVSSNGASRRSAGPEIFLCIEGQGSVHVPGQGPFPYRRGSTFLAPASVGEFRIEGDSVLFRARVARVPATGRSGSGGE
ncbi:MAG: mannose-6-phosphate isomerase, class I [Holophagales bacterium]|nr:mannose-6-phosphate isomerase, class I [Holophagales bacterium]